MIKYFISHRGNLSGRNENRENHPDYISEALSADFDVEVDVWFVDNTFVLGHDNPEYSVNPDFLRNDRFWCHAKNYAALNELLNIDAHCFWHQNDLVTLTSKNFPWVYPGYQPLLDSVAVMPELHHNTDISLCVGVCSDLILKYRGEYELDI